MLTGILLGLSAALLQSFSYVISSSFVRRYQRANLALLMRSYVLMGLVSTVTLALIWPPDGSIPPLRDYALPMVLCTVTCLLGQVAMFMTLRQTEASRMSPLLGLKIPMLAVTYSVLGLARYNAVQWLAIVLAVVAAFLLSRAGRSVTPGSWFWLIVSCALFAASDYYIGVQFEIFGDGLSLTKTSIIITLLSYVTGGIIGIAVMPFAGRLPGRVWLEHALPFAAAWLGAMLLLFGCFGIIGVVYGNIVQSTRGIISIVIGLIMARIGYVHLEERVGPAVALKRVAAAILMLLAVSLFKLKS